MVMNCVMKSSEKHKAHTLCIQCLGLLIFGRVGVDLSIAKTKFRLEIESPAILICGVKIQRICFALFS